MPFLSTRGGSPTVSLAEALRGGLAPDGGLYVPAAIPQLAAEEFESWRGRPFAAVATALLAPLTADTFDAPALSLLLGQALDFPVPLVQVEPDLAVLELFHGPTLAFKDFGARTMARWLAAVDDAPGDMPLTVLVATSGDTGGAVAQAFHGVAGTRVVVLYPRGRVSRMQEAQFATLGGNVTALAVEGTFDDCQRLVKEAFADAGLRAVHRLTSANSINIGRLLPQMAYYAWAALEAPGTARPLLVVPSGNLGNLSAGVLAARRGVPLGRFLAATTINDPFPRYLATGTFTPQAASQTLASAMDVGHPSNFERLAWLYGGVEAMRPAVAGAVVTDAQVRDAIASVARRTGYVADPHTAVGYVAAREHLARTGGTAIVLATAHPAKFPEVVEPAIGRALDIPPALADRLATPVRARRVEATLAALATALTTRA